MCRAGATISAKTIAAIWLQPMSGSEPLEQALAFFATSEVCRLEEWLMRLAEVTGNPAIRRAARALSIGSGRPAFDDKNAILEMGRLLRAGSAGSVESAARSAAACLPGQHSLQSAAKRLAKKYRQAQNIKCPDKATGLR